MLLHGECGRIIANDSGDDLREPFRRVAAAVPGADKDEETDVHERRQGTVIHRLRSLKLVESVLRITRSLTRYVFVTIRTGTWLVL